METKIKTRSIKRNRNDKNINQKKLKNKTNIKKEAQHKKTKWKYK